MIKNYDNTLYGQYIRDIENSDSIGFLMENGMLLQVLNLIKIIEEWGLILLLIKNLLNYIPTFFF